jgi:transposase
MKLPRFFNFENYEVTDIKEFLTKGRIEVYLKRKTDPSPRCRVCDGELGHRRGDHYMKIEAMPIMGYRTFIHFRRYKYHCMKCKKARSEVVEFLSEQTPHLTKELGWWIGRLCEIASVRRVAELVGHDDTTTWRLDYHRMVQMLSSYKLPTVKRITVDEVYARRRSKYFNKPKDLCYFTVITDLDTRKVIWVADGRHKEALDGFFKILGEEACKSIEVVATDQHEAYGSSVKEFCPNATVVWDKFHIIQNFEDVINESRLYLHERIPPNDRMRKLTRSKNKYIFMKKAKHRTESEVRLIEEVMKENETFYKLELIKERMFTLFEQPTVNMGLFVWKEIGSWIKETKIYFLEHWYETMNKKWDRIANYFKYRVTTALSEGINNVIKSIKRRGFGYRNMHYFKLKIMQVCGYLNSKYIPLNYR